MVESSKMPVAGNRKASENEDAFLLFFMTFHPVCFNNSCRTFFYAHSAVPAFFRIDDRQVVNYVNRIEFADLFTFFAANATGLAGASGF